LKQGEALPPLLFNFNFEYVIRAQVIQVDLKLNDALQLLVYVDDFNILGEGVLTIKENVESLVMASKESGL